ncbi:MAG: hypothetical protein AMJ65_00165 [Phycisphaerae bacterium SG8_4]|nr:MAG: hypothetical protein AMJ65_00165 [Phycisphaerae bacterium SG8_4]
MRYFRNSHRLGLLPLLVCAFLLVGCEDEEKKKAIEEAGQSRELLKRVEAKLTRAQKEIADLQELLYAVTDQRDKLDVQTKQLIEDQGKELATAQEARQGIGSLTTRSTVQAEDMATLQSQIDELTSIIQSQEKAIAEQEAIIAELLKTIEIQQQSVEEQQADQQEHEDVNESDLD